MSATPVDLRNAPLNDLETTVPMTQGHRMNTYVISGQTHRSNGTYKQYNTGSLSKLANN
jgi:hypothetical protein